MRKPTAKPDRKLDRSEAFREAAETLNATLIPGERSHGDEIHWKHGSW